MDVTEVKTEKTLTLVLNDVDIALLTSAQDEPMPTTVHSLVQIILEGVN